VKARTDHYKDKLAKQEALFKTQNEIFKQLQAQVSGKYRYSSFPIMIIAELVEGRINELKIMKAPQPATTNTQQSWPEGTIGKTTGTVNNAHINPAQDEVAMLDLLTFTI
jgi:hypothetical protein